MVWWKNNIYSVAAAFVAIVLMTACGPHALENTGQFNQDSDLFAYLAQPDSKSPTLPDDPDDEGPVSNHPQPRAHTGFVEPNLTPQQTAAVLAKYKRLDKAGQIPKILRDKAIVFYDVNLAHIPNKTRISIIDYSLHSKFRRFWILNMKTGSIWSMHVAHGKGSDDDHDGIAEKFSNEEGSNATSLGYYLTGNTYKGKNGLSMLLNGLSETNSNALMRKIVLHGAPYVQEAEVRQGRSWGCPAVAMENRNRVVALLKGGTLMFAGLSQSEILSQRLSVTSN